MKVLLECGYEHEIDGREDDPCRHGQVVLRGFQFGDTVPGHKEGLLHVAEQCGWCLLYGNTEPLTKDTRRCEKCSLGDHGTCAGCGCACSAIDG